MAKEYDEILDKYDVLYQKYLDFYSGDGEEPTHKDYDNLGDYDFLGQSQWYGDFGSAAFTDSEKANFSQALLRRAKFDKLVGWDRTLKLYDYNRKDFYDLEKASVDLSKDRALEEKTRYIVSRDQYSKYTVES